jgi:uncharacterized membrane protein
MKKEGYKKVICQICKKEKEQSEVIPAELVDEPIVEIIKKKYPEWSNEGYICLSDLNDFRKEFIHNIIETERGELTALEKDVVKSIREQELISKNVNSEFDQKLTFGQRLSDKIADFGGSWGFIILFFSFLIIWIIINSILLLLKSFDPYPFILLNLILSCLAAIQAPIILMSQNRQEARDRLRSEHDYRVNLKAELEIRRLSSKIDHLIRYQWQRLLEIQRIQTELIEELQGKTKDKN